MIDIDRIKEKGKLARELVSKGIATDIEDAYRIIERDGMVKKSGDDSGIFEPYSEKKKEDSPDKKAQQGEEKQKGQPKGHEEPAASGFDMRKLESIEKRIERLQNEFAKMMALFDNLKSYFDTNMDLLSKKLAEVEKQRSAPAEQKQEAQKEQVKEKQEKLQKDKKEKPKDKEEEKQYDVSIQNIFNNSNNRLNK